MKQYLHKLGLPGIAIIAFLVTGCLILSGTFVIVKSFTFTTQTGFYHYFVDITNEPDWEDHKDKIDNIDLVGFEMWFTNNEASDVTFHVYVDDADDPVYSTFADVDANATKVLDGIILPTGQSHITYGNSFKYIMAVDKLKELTKTGKFHYYGVSSGGSDIDYKLDSGKVIVTFSATN